MTLPAPPGPEAPPRDLGPLAWVMDELRATLRDAVEGVRQFVADNETARATDLAEVDAAPLRMLRQQLHQAAGALDMVDLSAAAQTLRALEGAVQRLVQKPSLATPEAQDVVARGARALEDYLDRLVHEHGLPDLSLFPVYDGWQQLAGAQRSHPADLWRFEPRCEAAPPPGKAYQPSAAVRAHLDRLVLPVVKSLHPPAAATLAQLSAGLSRGAADPAIGQFWLAAAAYFEAVNQAALPDDVHVKRAASRILLQYSHLGQGSTQGLDQLTHDLHFLAHQAATQASPATPCLQALVAAHGWAAQAPWDYHSMVLGQWDPQRLQTARQAVATAQQAWALWTEGDGPARTRAVAALHALAEGLQGLEALGAELASVWSQVALHLQSGSDAARPAAALALEVANSLLFLGAELDDWDPLDPRLATRHAALARRLGEVLAGQPAPEPEPWMTEVYRSLSERQTLRHLVSQLKAELGEVEHALDRFFRQPEMAALSPLPGRLEAMRGVMAMLGLAAAESTLAWLRDAVAQWALQPQPPQRSELAVQAQALGPNLSALGWLLETLGRQPTLAREAFVFDPDRQRLRSRFVPPSAAPVPDIVLPPPVAPPPAAPVTSSEPATVQAEVPDLSQDDDDSELLSVFTDEAREVLSAARSAVAVLRDTPASLSDLTALRRGFHTLKGSARMVGLSGFGEAAWAMEQLLNTWLADQQAASADLLNLCEQALEHLAKWVTALVQGVPPAEAGDAAALRRCADALRLEGRYLPLQASTEPHSLAPPAEPLPPVEPQPPVRQEEVKRIGTLSIDLELFNVYLAEAEEWSSRLNRSLGPWSQRPGTPLPEDASPLAHSLAGGSATVGYSGLAELARALEHALDRACAQPGAGAQLPVPQAQCLARAAEEARQLLHQFAAGLLKAPQPETLQGLAEVAEVASEPLAIDSLDADLFTVFEDEAQQILPALSAALRQWAAQPEQASSRAEALRLLHTFKGSARLAGALRLGDMAHQLESDVLALPETPAPDALRPLLQNLDAIVARFDELRSAFVDQAAGQPVTVAGVQPQAPESAGLAPAPETAAAAVLAPAVSPVAALAAMAPVTVRVRADLLDQLMAQTGDVMITRTRLEADMRALRQSFRDMTGNVERLRHQLRDLEMQTETQLQSRLAQSRDAEARFDPLEFDRYTRVQELTRLLAEAVNDVATVQHNLQRAVEGAEGNLAAQSRQTRELQRDLLRTRLLEFDALAERLHRVVRQTAQTLGKAVELHIGGGSVEVDRGVLDRLTPVLEHLLRNAVVHGIEPSEVRDLAGKPPVGRVTIELQQQGNDLALSLSDDGAGLDLPKLRERALAQGLVPDGAPFTDVEAARCIFAPGISTAVEVTELAGRGIGLDVVRSEVLGLGGHISCFTPEGGGTGFRMVLPLSTAVTQVVMLRVGDFTFGVPAPWVEVVRRAHTPELTAAYVSGQWREAGTLMPFHWAGALLGLSIESTDPQARDAHSWPVLEFYSAGQRVAWHVDEVLGHQEVVVKPLGPQLAHLPGLAGATVLASGAVALIYNPVALTSLYGEPARAWVKAQRLGTERGAPSAGRSSPPQLPGAGQAPLVLVVDDSITVRRVTQRLLKREGYRVVLAADGLQALERLREEAPVVVLCDIEMPRMDGFEFVRHLRGDAQWAGLPVVMITSRLADKHREHAQSVGVDHYLGKPYSEEELLALVGGYARLAGG